MRVSKRERERDLHTHLASNPEDRVEHILVKKRS